MKSLLKKILPVFLVIALAALLLGRGSADQTETVAFSKALEDVRAEKIEKIEIVPGRALAIVQYKNNKERSTGIPGEAGTKQLLRLAEQADIQIKSEPIPSEGPLAVISRILPPVILVAILLGFLGYQMGWFSRSKVEASSTGVSFDDVAGCGEAIEELQDVRSFLADPEKFESLGARVPKGVLLYGPPGTGKTLLAKAVASEAGIPFYSSSGSEFVEMFAGLGAKRVRQLFRQAKRSAPSIIFIDELDAVGGHRSSGGGDGGTREADQTLLQILKEMDGFDVSSDPVIVIGATNRISSLDTALVRPGRFDRHISIDPPDRRGRYEVLQVHARNKKIDPAVDLESLANQTAGMTGADLSLVLNEAALLAARNDHETILPVDVDDAYFRVVAGAKKQHRLFSDREREMVAYHEAGHALVGESLPGSEKLHKVSIIPRGQSGGQTLYVSEEDVFLHSRSQLEDRICGLLAGRASEEVFLGEISTGASDDLLRASQIVDKMVTELGMSRSLGLRSIGEDPLPTALADKAEEEMRNILDAQYKRATEILTEKENLVQKLAEALLEEETLDRERFLEILNEHP